LLPSSGYSIDRFVMISDRGLIPSSRSSRSSRRLIFRAKIACACGCPDAFARLPPPHKLAKLHHPQPPMGHRHPLSRAALAGKPGWRNVSEQVGNSF
jgi:hypothetical protein